MVRLHLEGMGLLGSLTAWQLWYRDVPFTWWDTNERHTAWKASTGACYPTSSDLDIQCCSTLSKWIDSGTYPAGCLSRAQYWVDSQHRTLPHGLKTDVIDELGPMRLVGTSYHVNAQKLVRRTRRLFKEFKRELQPKTSIPILSQGFSRADRYLWGWTRLVRLKLPKRIETRLYVPSFYLRKNRFQFAYCYPKPGTNWWYAGSNLINQKKPKELEIEKKYQGWKERFLELSGGEIGIKETGPFFQGWRPCAAEGIKGTEGHKAQGRKWLKEEDGKIIFPTMASNGFRHFPAVWKELQSLLEIK